MALLKSQAMVHCGRKAVLYDYVMPIGKRIKLARERLKRSKVWLGREVGVSKQAVGQWEKGGSVDPANYPALRKALRVTMLWLACGSGDPPQPDDPRVLAEDALQEAYEVLEKAQSA